MRVSQCQSSTHYGEQIRLDGVFPSVLAPLATTGEVMQRCVTDQARRLANVGGVRGLVVNRSKRESQVVSASDRLSIVERTRMGLRKDQILVTYLARLSESTLGEALEFGAAGADILLLSANDLVSKSKSEMVMTLLEEVVENSPIPVVISLEFSEANPRCVRPGLIRQTVKQCPKLMGIDVNFGSHSFHFDRLFCELQSIDRPIAVACSSVVNSFHSLNTGANAVLSTLAYLAPHETVDLVSYVREGRFFDAQATHNRLMPLCLAIYELPAGQREDCVRFIAHHRGLLAQSDRSTNSCAEPEARFAPLMKVLDNLRLKPVVWT